MKNYNGLDFVPYRAFTEAEKQMSLPEMDRHFAFAWDFELGMFDSAEVHGHPQKFPYNHTRFYECMGDDGWADIYICQQTGKYYIPCTRTIMEARKIHELDNIPYTHEGVKAPSEETKDVADEFLGIL